MNGGDGIVIGRAKRSRPAIPPQDFADARYDDDSGTPLRDLLLVFSTPRSGSTMLCEWLYRGGGCLAHEYLQRFDYLPIFARRWGCLRRRVVDVKAYAAQLARFRTHRNGWLGINLHGEHIPAYAKLEPHLEPLRKHYLHLLRRDTLAQAVSFAIAAQTQQWSSRFAAAGEPTYSYDTIAHKLRRIGAQNNLIRAFLRARGVTAHTIYYEDLVAEPTAVLQRVPGVVSADISAASTGLRKQATRRNAKWVKRFATEHLARAVATK